MKTSVSIFGHNFSKPNSADVFSSKEIVTDFEFDFGFRYFNVFLICEAYYCDPKSIHRYFDEFFGVFY